MHGSVDGLGQGLGGPALRPGAQQHRHQRVQAVPAEEGGSDG
jgi:hypothetical protein